MSPLVVGSIGVGLLLAAFVLNLLRVLSERSRTYLMMNFIGAGLACWYAWQDRTLPFVILEGVWGLTALVRMLMTATRNPRTAGG